MGYTVILNKSRIIISQRCHADKHRSVFICVYLWLAIASFARAVSDFAHDIAPLIYEKCAPCHHPGAAAPFSLLTYEDVKKRAAQIAAATRCGLYAAVAARAWLWRFRGRPPPHHRPDRDHCRLGTATALPKARRRDTAPAGFHRRMAAWQTRPGAGSGKLVRVASFGTRYLLERHLHSQPDRAALGARHRDPPRPTARGASCQPAGGSRGIGAPAGDARRARAFPAWIW